MSLQLPVIDRLFGRLISTYGSDFKGRYQGVDENAVKSAWAHELSGFQNNLTQIGWALENLPERAPNVIEFRNLCRRAPETEKPRLEAPKADPAIAKMIAEKLAAVPFNPAGRLDWAKIILANQKGRTPTVIQMAENALL
jgi:hypothetical protein